MNEQKAIFNHVGRSCIIDITYFSLKINVYHTLECALHSVGHDR